MCIIADASLSHTLPFVSCSCRDLSKLICTGCKSPTGMQMMAAQDLNTGFMLMRASNYLGCAAHASCKGVQVNIVELEHQAQRCLHIARGIIASGRPHTAWCEQQSTVQLMFSSGNPGLGMTDLEPSFFRVEISSCEGPCCVPESADSNVVASVHTCSSCIHLCNQVMPQLALAVNQQATA